MTSPAAAAADDRPRRRLYTQLWFWVMIAIGAGIAFGLAAPGHRQEGEVARRRVHPAHPDDHRPGDLRHRRARHRVDRQPGARRRARAKALAYFFSMTVVALALGLIAGNLVAPGSGFEGQPERGRRASAKDPDRRGRRRQRARPVHHRRPPARLVRAAVRRERDPAHPGHRLLTAAAISFLRDARAQAGRGRVRDARRGSSSASSA